MSVIDHHWSDDDANVSTALDSFPDLDKVTRLH